MSVEDVGDAFVEEMALALKGIEGVREITGQELD